MWWGWSVDKLQLSAPSGIASTEDFLTQCQDILSVAHIYLGIEVGYQGCLRVLPNFAYPFSSGGIWEVSGVCYYSQCFCSLSCLCLLERTCTSFSRMDAELDLLNHRLCLSSLFLDSAKLFSKAVVLINNRICGIEIFLYSIFSQALDMSRYLIFWTGESKCYFIVVWGLASFCIYRPFKFPVLRDVCSSYPFFYCFFILIFKRSLFWILILCSSYVLQIFLLTLFFSVCSGVPLIKEGVSFYCSLSCKSFPFWFVLFWIY